MSEPPRVRDRRPGCTQPYDMALLNVSAMSFGSLSANAIEALNRGAAAGRLRPRHRRGGDQPLPPPRRRPGLGDRLGLLRLPHRRRRVRRATSSPTRPPTPRSRWSPQAQPGRQARHRWGAARSEGDQGDRRDPRRAAGARRSSRRPTTRSSRRRASWCSFIGRMRELAGGKPTGFKLCLGSRSDFLAICKAMLEEDVTPDFIIVDGAEGGTGAAPVEYSDHVGMPLTEGLMTVHNALRRRRAPRPGQDRRLAARSPPGSTWSSGSSRAPTTPTPPAR